MEKHAIAGGLNYASDPILASLKPPQDIILMQFLTRRVVHVSALKASAHPHLFGIPFLAEEV